MITDLLNGYSIENANGGYYYHAARNGSASVRSRKKYPTHCMARMAAIRFLKSA